VEERWNGSGTTLVKDIYWNGSSSPGHLAAMGNMVFFAAEGTWEGRNLWKSDGTAEGTVMVKDFYPGSSHNVNPAELTVIGNTVYFRVAHPAHGTELWKTDGTAAGTVLVRDIRPGTAGSNPNS
jgi:ELWxxDGT repeat protein